ncbi:HIRAN domain-containing protein [Mesorhizobium sp. CC13]|uniref:HIRAN domain-containing protein n=1 Tax=Mesorhizobium sp. CC13 TaxID=3029194 RepID=UPI00326730D4
MDAVGERNYQDTLAGLCRGHSRYGHSARFEAEIAREPQNPHDENAVVVSIKGQKVAYLPREQAARVSAGMQHAGLSVARCAAEIVGGWRTNQHDEGSFGVRLAIPTRGAIDFGNGMVQPQDEGDISHRSEKRRSSSRPAAADGGPFAGHRIAIMGAPTDGPEAHQLAQAGATVTAGVGKTTTILVVIGEEPFDFGIRRSRSYQKAEELIACGSPIRIMPWSAVRRMIQSPE